MPVRRTALLVALAVLAACGPLSPAWADTDWEVGDPSAVLDPSAVEFLEWCHAHCVEVLPGVHVLPADAPAIRAWLKQARRDAYAPVLDCLAERESERDSGGTSRDGWQARNPRSGTLGRYQFTSRTGRYAVQLAGHGEWAGVGASGWPAHVQDDAAIALIVDQGGHVGPAWGHPWCDRLLP